MPETPPGIPAQVYSARIVAAQAPLEMRPVLFQDLSLPGQPRDRSAKLIEIKGSPRPTGLGCAACGGISSRDGWIHFGLGGGSSAQVRVVWPDGETGPWMAVQADQFVAIDRGVSSPSPWSPAKP